MIMKVLMIDDDPDVVEAVSLALQVKLPEAQLLSATLAGTGLDIIKAENPDVVILDLGLPDMNGFDALRLIRAFSTVPVLILSVWGEKSQIQQGLELGANDYVVKPFSQMQLMDKLKELASPRGD